MPESIDKQLNDTRVRLVNAKTDAALQEKLAPRGYTPEKLDEGLALYKTAADAQDTLQKEGGEQEAATDAFTEAHKTCRELYDPHVGYARVLFDGDREARKALGFSGRRKRSTAGWIRQAQQFYANALADPDYVAKFAGISIPQTELEDGQARAAAVAAADETQEREKGDAQRAKDKRDQALDALDDFMDPFLGIARVALADDPQLLEKLMIRAPS
ncbi:hypothetical protein [Rubrivirga sp. IMCC45206]|uniref:hypothetical protein n=1 Tax=Rubrivirga sp. IMCC45206 TaxID=3391614 RepID=UPI00398FBAC5